MLSTLILQPNFFFQQQPVNKLITYIFEWTTACHTFSAIYSERHPGRAQELLYAEIICFACRTFGGLDGLHMMYEPSRPRILPDHRLLLMASCGLKIFTPSGSGTSPFCISSFNKQPSLNFPNTPGEQRRVCFPFNLQAGCFLENCMYQQICSLCRAKGHNRLTECAALTTMAEKVLEKGIITFADLYRESLPTKKYVSNKAVWLIMGMPFVIKTVESSGNHKLYIVAKESNVNYRTLSKSMQQFKRRTTVIGGQTLKALKMMMGMNFPN